MLTLLHAADLHLDSPFRSLPPQEAQRRRADQRKALEALAELARERQVDLALLPGDLFDSQQVYPETLEALSGALGKMGCPVVIAPGNHDYYSTRSPYARAIWPDNTHIFKDEAVTPLPLPELGVTVYGYAFTSPFRDSDPLAGFHAPDDGTVALGCFHTQVGRQNQYAPIPPESLENSGLAYAALGHVHARSPLQGDRTPWAYPGCPQGRGFDELGDRGVYLVTLPEDGGPTLEFLPLPGPRYRELEVELTRRAPADAVTQALSGCGADYVRLILTGESHPLDIPALQALGDGLCAVLQLIDRTAPPADLWARAGEDTLTGHFLREMRARLDAAPEADRPILHLALGYGLAALEGREQPR